MVEEGMKPQTQMYVAAGFHTHTYIIYIYILMYLYILIYIYIWDHTFWGCLIWGDGISNFLHDSERRDVEGRAVGGTAGFVVIFTDPMKGQLPSGKLT